MSTIHEQRRRVRASSATCAVPASPFTPNLFQERANTPANLADTRSDLLTRLAEFGFGAVASIGVGIECSLSVQPACQPRDLTPRPAVLERAAPISTHAIAASGARQATSPPLTDTLARVASSNKACSQPRASALRPKQTANTAAPPRASCAWIQPRYSGKAPLVAAPFGDSESLASPTKSKRREAQYLRTSGRAPSGSRPSHPAAQPANVASV